MFNLSDLIHGVQRRLGAARFNPQVIAQQKVNQRDSRLLILTRNLAITNHELPQMFPNTLRLRQLLIAPIRFLDLLDQLNQLVSAEEINYLRSRKARLLLDMSVEAMNFSGYSEEKLLLLHQALNDARVNPDSVLLLNANVASPRAMAKWAEKHRLSRAVHCLGYSFYLFEYLSELLMSEWFAKTYPVYRERRLQELTAPGKRLLVCLNLRPRPHRLAMVLFLIRRGLLDRSIVSFFGEDFGHSDTRSVASRGDALNFVRSLPNGLELIESLPRLEAMAPITVDRDAGNMRKDLWDRKPGEIAFLFPETTADGTPICTTHFEIVTETWFTDDSCLYVTEKTIRPIIRMQPFIVIGCPGTLAYLRSLGFQTFSPYIDENYDTIVDPAQRLDAIFREVERLAALGEADLNNIQRSLLPRLQHNAEWYLKQGRRLARDEITGRISSGLK
jgi:hypothetical protein